jgi:uncharacterized protein YbjQ (UPF0145 family)
MARKTAAEREAERFARIQELHAQYPDVPLTPDGVEERPEPPRVQSERVTTLQELPGYRVTRVLGVVTDLSAASGFTASMKGQSALTDSMRRLRSNAAAMGANAVLALTSSAFGAAGGITSAFGGDAVGILLVGTAVVVEPSADRTVQAEGA